MPIIRRFLRAMAFCLARMAKPCLAIRLRERISGIACKAERIELPEGLLEIGDHAFDGSRLAQMDLPEGLVSIGDGAFGTCLSLARLSIPKSVTHIGSLRLVPDFRELKVEKGNTALEIRDGALINWEEKTLIRYLPYAKGLEYTVPNGIQAIADYAFIGSQTLERVILPEGLASIGDYAFAYCKALNDIVLPEGLTSIGTWAFTDTYGIRYLSIPSSVTVIDPFAFYSTASLTLLVHKAMPKHTCVNTRRNRGGYTRYINKKG